MRFVALREMTFATPDGGLETLARGETVEQANEGDLMWWEHSGPNIRHSTGGWERFQIQAIQNGHTPILYRWRGRIRFGIAGTDVGFVMDVPPSVTPRRRST